MPSSNSDGGHPGGPRIGRTGDGTKRIERVREQKVVAEELEKGRHDRRSGMHPPDGRVPDTWVDLREA